MDSSFQLDSAERDRVYADTIEPAFFLATKEAGKPVIVIIAGQPGVGKSKVSKLSFDQFADANFVSVNTDDMRLFHPRFEEIVALDDRLSAERTHEDASAWSEKLLSRSIETRRNVVLEGVFKDGPKLLGIIERAREAGFEVIVRVVAAHERFSVWGIHERYEQEKITRGHGRFVPLKYHDACYEKVLDSCESVENQKLVDKIEVYNRDGECLYANGTAFEWTHPPAVRAAIEKERSRKLTNEQRSRYQESWDRVVELMENRRAPKSEIEAVKELGERFIKEC